MLKIEANGQNIRFDSFNFPGGEVHIRLNMEDIASLIKEESDVQITSIIRNSDDLMRMLLAVNAVKSNAKFGQGFASR